MILADVLLANFIRTSLALSPRLPKPCMVLFSCLIDLILERRLRIESAPVEAQHGFRVRFSDVFFIPAEGEEKPQRYRVILHFSISYVYDKPC